MFYFLHRLVKWVFIALFAAGLYWVWLQREALEPLYVWHDVYQNGGLKNSGALHKIHGRATSVVDGHTFQMFQDGRSISVRLAGLQLPEPPLSPSDLQLEKKRRQVLREMVINKELDVQVTSAVPGGMLGIVMLQQTNLNTYFVTNGLGKFNSAYVQHLPRDVQYRFFAAERFQEKQAEQAAARAEVASTNQ